MGGGQVPVSPRPSGRLLSGQLSSRLSAHLPSQVPAEQLQTAASKPESSLEEGGLEPRVPWYRQRSLQLVLAGYASIAFLMNFLEELTPIYASAPYRLVRISAYCHSCCWLERSQGNSRHRHDASIVFTEDTVRMKALLAQASTHFVWLCVSCGECNAQEKVSADVLTPEPERGTWRFFALHLPHKSMLLCVGRAESDAGPDRAAGQLCRAGARLLCAAGVPARPEAPGLHELRQAGAHPGHPARPGHPHVLLCCATVSQPTVACG